MKFIRGTLVAQRRLRTNQVSRLLCPTEDKTLDEEKVHNWEMCVYTDNSWKLYGFYTDTYLLEPMKPLFSIASDEELLFILNGLKENEILVRALIEWVEIPHLLLKEYERLMRLAQPML